MRDDIDLLQGTWNITALEVDGQKMPSGDADRRLTSLSTATVSPARVWVRCIRARSNWILPQEPRQLNMRFDAGPEKGNTNPGIYELAGDTWKICLATRGDVRPSNFVTTAGSGFALETLTRSSA